MGRVGAQPAEAGWVEATSYGGAERGPGRAGNQGEMPAEKPFWPGRQRNGSLREALRRLVRPIAGRFKRKRVLSKLKPKAAP